MEDYLRWLQQRRARLAAAGTSSRCTASGWSASCPSDRRPPAGLSRHGAGARRQPGARALPARRVRQHRARRGAGLPRPPPAAPRRRGASFAQLEAVGEQALRVHDQPDAGMWELRTRARVHTSSALMCWAACDRLAKIAAALGLPERAALLARPRRRASADEILAQVVERGAPGLRRELRRPRARRQRAADGRGAASSTPRDPRFVSTVEAHGEVAVRRPVHAPLRGARRLRQARDGLQHLHLLAHRCARQDRPQGRGAPDLRDHARGAQPARPAVGRHAPGHRRDVGQLPADLFDGRHHQRGGAAVRALGLAPYEPARRRFQPRGRSAQAGGRRPGRGAGREPAAKRRPVVRLERHRSSRAARPAKASCTSSRPARSRWPPST